MQSPWLKAETKYSNMIEYKQFRDKQRMQTKYKYNFIFTSQRKSEEKGLLHFMLPQTVAVVGICVEIKIRIDSITTVCVCVSVAHFIATEMYHYI